MNEDTIADLKQFISATVSQATAHLATKDDLTDLEHRMDVRFAEVDKRFDEVDRRFDEVQAAIADSITTLNDVTDERITKLEQQLA